jgi:hypothetical protein
MTYKCRKRHVFWIHYESKQQVATIQINLFFYVSSTCFGRCFRPSSEAHPRLQPEATWVNTTRYCKYSQVLLMMGEKTPKHVQLTKKNKLTHIAASCWLLLWLYHDAQIHKWHVVWNMSFMMSVTGEIVMWYMSTSVLKMIMSCFREHSCLDLFKDTFSTAQFI